MKPRKSSAPLASSLKATSSNLEAFEIRYTLDGSHPTKTSLVYKKTLQLNDTTTVKAQVFRDNQAISGVVEKTFRKVPLRQALKAVKGQSGLQYSYYHGQWEALPDFRILSPEAKGTVEGFDISPRTRKENFGFCFAGLITVPEDGLYRFFLTSDDGSRLLIGDELVVDNDRLHGPTEVMGQILLAKGSHPIRVDFFQRSGGTEFEVSYSGPGIDKQPVSKEILSHNSAPRK